MPIDSRVRNLGVSLVSRCNLYLEEEENFAHIFNDCNFAKALSIKPKSADDFKGKEMLTDLRISSAHVVMTKAMWIKNPEGNVVAATAAFYNRDGFGKGNYSLEVAVLTLLPLVITYGWEVGATLRSEFIANSEEEEATGVEDGRWIYGFLKD
ncbi:unnamed protein product [Ilex paraguariensis]|uniref:Reverse transcriptase zinc-binding domain-containing protein n=1 Tax=Ilex paraguariensis TaxID=185542 RepID=A0ABC8R529_9AQUA